MTIRFRRWGGERARGLRARWRVQELQLPEALPPEMWLPPMRVPAPRGVPSGIALGAFKPQREVIRSQPPVQLSPDPGFNRDITHRLHAVLIAGFGGLGGLLALLAALDAGDTSAVGDPPESVTPGPQAAALIEPGLVQREFVELVDGPEWVAPATEEGAVTAASLAVETPAAEPKGRWQLPLERWTAVTDRYGAPRGHGIVHGGIDLALDDLRRSPVKTACEGIVTSTGYSRVYGYHVIVDCGDGWSSLYGHLSEIRVQAGQTLTFADYVGVSGASGLAEGEHLHFEVRWQDAPVNPEHYLDFGIPSWAPLTYDRRDANGNLITPEPPKPPATAMATNTPTVTPTATPTNTPTPRPTRTADEEATAEAIKNVIRR